MGIIKRLFCKHKKKIHFGTYLEDIGNGIKETRKKLGDIHNDSGYIL